MHPAALLILSLYAVYAFRSEEVPDRPGHDTRGAEEILPPRGKGKGGGEEAWAVPAPVSGEPAGGGGGGGFARGAATPMETRKEVDNRVAFLERLAEECDAEVIAADWKRGTDKRYSVPINDIRFR